MSKSEKNVKSEIIARKSWKNAKAFITVDFYTKKIEVSSKFYDDGRAHSGPSTTLPYTMPQYILDDIKEHIENRWPMGSQSQQLAEYIQKIWIDAQAQENWFTYPV